MAVLYSCDVNTEPMKFFMARYLNMANQIS